MYKLQHFLLNSFIKENKKFDLLSKKLLFLFIGIKNYKLIFSYSGKKEYQNSVNSALQTDNPLAVVFKDSLPKSFLNRPVLDGDKSDLVNVLKGKNKVIGLLAKGSAKTNVNHFVVDNNIILRG